MTGRRRRHHVLRQMRRRAHRPGTSPGTLAVHPDAPRPVIRLTAYGAEEIVEKTIARPEDIEPFLGRWPVTWVDVTGFGDTAVLRRLGDRFGIHRLALEDVVNLGQRSKLEPYGDLVFVVAHTFHHRGPALESRQLSLFLGPGFVLTFQEPPEDDFAVVRDRLRIADGKIRQSGIDYLAYALLDAVVDGYFPLLEEYGERLEGLEERILEAPEEVEISQLHQARRELMAIQRNLWPQRDVFAGLLREVPPPFTEETAVYLRDVHDHAVRVLDLVTTYREAASSLMEVYLSTLSNRMNEVMKVLTIIATIFIPLSFITGLYGMNFNPDISPWNMPELDWVYGYPFALSLMAVVAGGLLWYFRRKKWL